MSDVIGGFLTAVFFAFLCWAGWVHAHNTVAYKCDKLGIFYVNEKIYECKLKEKNT